MPVIAVLLLWAVATAPPVGAQPDAAHPNFVLFIADDLGAADIAPYGHPIVRTPNLSRLAEESLRFTRAYASSPTCAPSRSTIYTGLMPFRNGAHGNHSGVREGLRSIVHYLSELGYRVAVAGKLHVGPREVFPFEYVKGTNAVEPGYEDAPVLRWDLDMGPVDRWLSEQVREKPFALIVADHSPHVVWPDTPAYDPDSVEIPANHIDTPDYRRSRARYYTDITKMDRNVGKLLESLDRHGLTGRTVVAFTSDQGPQVAFAKWSLYEAGIRTPLLVRLPDGKRAGEATSALVSLADLTPTFVDLAGGIPPVGIDGLSFRPVLEGAATHREQVFATHTGDRQMNRSPARMLRTERFKYILNLAPDVPYTTHMDRAREHDGGREYWDSWRAASYRNEHAAAVLWRYRHHPSEELYDLENDPMEWRNLAAEPAYQPLLAALRKRMADWRADQGDAETGPEVLPETGPGENREPVAPYIF